MMADPSTDVDKALGDCYKPMKDAATTKTSEDAETPSNSKQKPAEKDGKEDITIADELAENNTDPTKDADEHAENDEDPEKDADKSSEKEENPSEDEEFPVEESKVDEHELDQPRSDDAEEDRENEEGRK